MQQVYICIDLKSFFASVECVERGLDPMTAKLVVADPTRTEKTICLAVSPALRALGVRNRCRVFEIPPRLDYIMAQPRMALYIRYSAKIYSIYLRYFSPKTYTSILSTKCSSTSAGISQCSAKRRASL